MTDTRRERKHFLLRLQPDLHAALESWAAQEMRSVNGQIEWILREAVRRRGGGAGREDPARTGGADDGEARDADLAKKPS